MSGQRDQRAPFVEGLACEGDSGPGDSGDSTLGEAVDSDFSELIATVSTNSSGAYATEVMKLPDRDSRGIRSLNNAGQGEPSILLLPWLGLTHFSALRY